MAGSSPAMTWREVHFFADDARPGMTAGLQLSDIAIVSPTTHSTLVSCSFIN
jgi:hypothetical protein